MTVDILREMKDAVYEASAVKFLKEMPADVEDLLREFNGVTTECSILGLAKTFIEIAWGGFRTNQTSDLVPRYSNITDGFECLDNEDYWDLALRYYDCEDRPHPIFLWEIEQLEDIEDFMEVIKTL